ncbi:hypothetical protein OWR29_30895 [Actinoplanes sp. Pm04-4]|uniref:SCP domain-containing protein n=1 Tax=Paractinoplanes pyxinae TaxID=2997416 RepID=A0ABT4B7E2_9ACTN|nr:hypothetical protein [Actinoplanes pyxinae]MCY1142428.1 hypothetical protein [Actinoplanes pyxinae]
MPEVTFPVSMSAAARFRYTLAAGATAVVIGAGFTVAGLTKHADAETTATVNTGADRALVVDEGTAEPAPPTLAPSPSAGSATPTTKPSASKSPSPKPSKKKATAKPKPKPTATKTKKAAPQTSGSVAEQVLAHINDARKAEGLGTLSLDANLSRAAAIHNQLMIDGCGLSHQCSGEGGIGDRFSDQGVK